MLRSNQLLNSVFSFTAGIVLGLVAANFYSATDNKGNESTAALTAPPFEAAEVNKLRPVLAATDKVPQKMPDGLASSATDRVDAMMPGVDISLAETVDMSRQEMATTESSPEELAKQPQLERVVRLGDQETHELENTLRQESASAAQVRPQQNAGLLGHEML